MTLKTLKTLLAVVGINPSAFCCLAQAASVASIIHSSQRLKFNQYSGKLHLVNVVFRISVGHSPDDEQLIVLHLSWK